eukprot:751291-Hanusia_phi.AAC.2
MQHERPKRNRRVSSKFLEAINSTSTGGQKLRLSKVSSRNKVQILSCMSPCRFLLDSDAKRTRQLLYKRTSTYAHGEVLVVYMFVPTSALEELPSPLPLSEYVDLGRSWLNPISTSTLGKHENDTFSGSLDACRLPDCVGYSNYCPPAGFGWEKLVRGREEKDSDIRRRVQDFVDVSVSWMTPRNRKDHDGGGRNAENGDDVHDVSGSLHDSCLPLPADVEVYDPPQHHLSLCINEGGLSEPDFEDPIGEVIAIVQGMSESKKFDMLSTIPADVRKMIVMRPEKFFERFKVPLGLDSLVAGMLKRSKQSSKASAVTPRRLFDQLLSSIRFTCELFQCSEQVRSEAREVLLRFVRLASVRILPAAIDGRIPFVHGLQWLGHRVGVVKEERFKLSWGVIDDYDGKDRYHIIDDDGDEGWWALPSLVVDLFPERREELKGVKVVSKGDMLLCKWKKVESIDLLFHAEVVGVDFDKKGLWVKFSHLPDDVYKWIDMLSTSVLLSERVVTCFKNGRALFHEDSTPRLIARQLNLSEEELVHLNRMEFPELHACSKLKRGTLLVLPVMCASELREGEQEDTKVVEGRPLASPEDSCHKRNHRLGMADSVHLMRLMSRRAGQLRLLYGSLAVRHGASLSFLGAKVVVDCSDARHIGRVCAYHAPSKQYRIKLNPLVGGFEEEGDAGEIYTSLPCEHVKVVRTILEEGPSDGNRDEQETGRERVQAEGRKKQEVRRVGKRKVEALDACALLLLNGKPDNCVSSVLSNLPDGPKSCSFCPNLRYGEDGRLLEMVPLYDDDRRAFLTDDRAIDLFGLIQGDQQQEQAQLWQELEAEASAGAGLQNEYSMRSAAGVSSELLRKAISDSFARLNPKERSSVLGELLGELGQTEQVSVCKAVINKQVKSSGAKRSLDTMERGGGDQSSFLLQMMSFFFPRANQDSLLEIALGRRKLSSTKQSQAAGEQRAKRVKAGDGDVGSQSVQPITARYSLPATGRAWHEMPRYDHPPAHQVPQQHQPLHANFTHPPPVQPVYFSPSVWTGCQQLQHLYPAQPLTRTAAPDIHADLPSPFSGHGPLKLNSNASATAIGGAASVVSPYNLIGSSLHHPNMMACHTSNLAADTSRQSAAPQVTPTNSFPGSSPSISTHVPRVSNSKESHQHVCQATAMAQGTATHRPWQPQMPPQETSLWSRAPSSVGAYPTGARHSLSSTMATRAPTQSSGQSWAEPNLELSTQAGIGGRSSDLPTLPVSLLEDAVDDDLVAKLNTPLVEGLNEPIMPEPQQLQDSMFSGDRGSSEVAGSMYTMGSSGEGTSMFGRPSVNGGGFFDLFLIPEQQAEHWRS